MDTAKKAGTARRQTARGLVALAFAAGLLLAAGTAQGEPYMTVREGYKCSQCHVNKTGGGARTDYAKVYMETRLAASPGSLFRPAGDPAKGTDLGHGRLTPYVAVGADLRTDYTATKMDHASATSQFDRPKTCESCHASTGGGGKRAEAFLRLEALPDVATIVYQASLVPNNVTKELYAVLDVLPGNGYVKVGTFRLPTGLQNTFDTPFQHASQGGYQGLLGLETVRAKGGIEFGFEPGPFSISVSLTNADDTDQATNSQRVMASAYAVSRLGTLGLAYASDPVTNQRTRTLTEMYAGFSIGRLTLLGQLDQLEDKDSSAGTTVKQMGVLGEADFLLAKGHNLRLLYEARDPDLDTKNDIRDRASVIYEPFLTPYLQLRAGYRKYAGPVKLTNDNNGTQMFAEAHVTF
jgi:hypothetical protein